MFCMILLQDLNKILQIVYYNKDYILLHIAKIISPVIPLSNLKLIGTCMNHLGVFLLVSSSQGVEIML